MNKTLKPSFYLESLAWKQYEKLENDFKMILFSSKRITNESIYACLKFDEASDLLAFLANFGDGGMKIAFKYYQKLGWVSLDYLIPKKIIRFMEKYEGI